MTGRISERADFIRWTVVWLGGSCIALGVGLEIYPKTAMSGTPDRYLRMFTVPTWGAIWMTVGAVTILCALLAWKAALAPLIGIVGLMLFWSVKTAEAMVGDHGKGIIGTVVWASFAGTVWFAALRAARTPKLRKGPE